MPSCYSVNWNVDTKFMRVKILLLSIIEGLRADEFHRLAVKNHQKFFIASNISL